MASIPIHNETAYTLTDDITQQIIGDAHEHFGEEVRAIRVQSGIARHALNARTREVRYAFFPQDFGLGHTMPAVQEHAAAVADLPTIDEEPEAAIIAVPFEEDEEEGEDMEPLATSLESLDEEQDDEEEDDVFTLDDPVEDADEEEEDNVFDHAEDDED
jgi:hypothetical protein